MADELRKSGFDVKSVLKLLLGVIVILAGIYFTVTFLRPLKLIIAGSIGPFLILVGLVIVAVAKE